jgi:hypothetical protein
MILAERRLNALALTRVDDGEQHHPLLVGLPRVDPSPIHPTPPEGA